MYGNSYRGSDEEVGLGRESDGCWERQEVEQWGQHPQPESFYHLAVRGRPRRSRITCAASGGGWPVTRDFKCV